MAGGGATIEFLRKAIERPVEIDGKRLQVKVTNPEGRVGSQHVWCLPRPHGRRLGRGKPRLRRFAA